MTAQALVSRGLGIGFEDDAIAEAFEAAFEVRDASGLPDLVEIGFVDCGDDLCGQPSRSLDRATVFYIRGTRS